MSTFSVFFTASLKRDATGVLEGHIQYSSSLAMANKAGRNKDAPSFLSALVSAVRISESEFPPDIVDELDYETTQQPLSGGLRFRAESWPQLYDTLSQFRDEKSLYKFRYDYAATHSYDAYRADSAPAAYYNADYSCAPQTCQRFSNLALSRYIALVRNDRFSFTTAANPEVVVDVGKLTPTFSALLPVAQRLGELNAPVLIGTTDYGIELCLAEEWRGTSPGLVAAAAHQTPFVSAVHLGRWSALIRTIMLQCA